MNQTGQGSGQMDPEQARQFSRELETRRQQAESLRDGLKKQGVNTDDLDKVLANLRQLQNGPTDDPRTIGKLQTSVIDGLKQFEFSLFQQFGLGSSKQPAVGSSAEVPPEYRALVEEYWRQIAKQQKKQ
jgi:hypothetical protein